MLLCTRTSEPAGTAVASVVCRSTAVYVHAHSVIVAAAVSLFIYNLQNNTRGERESF